MADNVEITAGAGTKIAADEIGDLFYQRMKLAFGTDGSATDVSPATGMPVAPSANLPGSDANAGALTGVHAAPALVFNGSAWDRIRNVTAVDDSGSTGLLAAGLIGHDAAASVNRRVKVDGIGYLYMREPPAVAAALTSVAAAATTGTLLAANTARRGVIIINESTATLYLAYAATATATAYTQAMAGGSTWEMPMPVFTGLISGIWSAANGAARITQLT